MHVLRVVTNCEVPDPESTGGSGRSGLCSSGPVWGQLVASEAKFEPTPGGEGTRPPTKATAQKQSSLPVRTRTQSEAITWRT